MVVGVIAPAGRRTIAHGRFGVADGRPMVDLTVFKIGSVTKIFTSLLLADMARRGEVALTDHVARHLPPDLPLKPNAAQMTLADLATHMAGLPFWPSNLAANGDTMAALADYSVEDLFRFAATFDARRLTRPGAGSTRTPTTDCSARCSHAGPARLTRQRLRNALPDPSAWRTPA